MKSLRRTTGEDGVSPVIASILVVAVVVVLSLIIGVFVFDLGTNLGQSSSAGVDIDEGDAAVSVRLLDGGTSEGVFVETSLGTRYPIEQVGGVVTVLAVNDSPVNVISVAGGQDTLVRSIQSTSGYNPDVIVAKDGSGDYETIQAGVDNAESGETVLVKQANYSENINISTSNITLVGEHGTVIEDAHPLLDVVYIEADEVSMQNFIVDGDPIPGDGHYARNCITVAANDVTITANTLRNCVGGPDTTGVGLSINSISTTVISNSITDSEVGLQFESGGTTHYVRQNSLSNNSEYNAVNDQSTPVDLQHNSWDTENPQESVSGPADTYPQSDGSTAGELTSSDSTDSTPDVEEDTSTEDSNGAPVANAGADRTISQYEEVTFDAGESYDPDGDSISYEWEFSDDSTVAEPTASKTYETAGTYTVTLTVTDSEGASDTATTTISVSSTAPLANAGSDTISSVGDTVSFDGSGSSDPNDDIVTYTWTFHDDTTASGTTASYTYSTQGVYDVTLTVVDANGESNEDHRQVTVDDPPVADAGEGASVNVSESVSFDATASSDPNGDDLTYEWDFGDSNSDTGATSSHAYDSGGMYEATVTVTDEYGLSTTDTVSIDVNAPPVAQAGSNQTVEEQETVAFDAGESRDSDGDDLTYEWDFDEDGTTDATSATPTTSYAAAGTYEVALTVTDAHGVTDTDVVYVTVTAIPNINLGDPFTITAGDTVKFDASVSYNGSSDLTYSWDLDGEPSTIESNSANPSHTYTETGEVDVSLTVTDGEREDTDTVAITVEPNTVVENFDDGDVSEWSVTHKTDGLEWSASTAYSRSGSHSGELYADGRGTMELGFSEEVSSSGAYVFWAYQTMDPHDDVRVHWQKDSTGSVFSMNFNRETSQNVHVNGNNRGWAFPSNTWVRIVVYNVDYEAGTYNWKMERSDGHVYDSGSATFNADEITGVDRFKINTGHYGSGTGQFFFDDISIGTATP